MHVILDCVVKMHSELVSRCGQLKLFDFQMFILR